MAQPDLTYFLIYIAVYFSIGFLIVRFALNLYKEHREESAREDDL